MKLAGIVVILLGWVIAIMSLTLENTSVQLAVVLAGFIVSLVGIIGVLNRAYLAEAIWKQ
jgi:uncharacterized membrane protein YjjB (DUF3815 family)